MRYPARLEWLHSRLEIENEFLPVVENNSFEKTLKILRPASASMIFPAGFLNSPASMYGHTFLVLHSEEKIPLLYYAVNYAAVTTESFGPSFAIMGWSALPGLLFAAALLRKGCRYSDMDQRDMWEYPLQLSQEQVVRLVKHLYELNVFTQNTFS